MKRSKGLGRRTPSLSRSSLPRRRTSIRRLSERRAALSHDDAAAGDRVRVRDGGCVLCGQLGYEAHHRLPRGQGGALRDPTRFALSRLVWLCRECHCWVESHRTLAYGLGLLVRRGVTRCSDAPVYHHGRWVLLTDDGQIVPTSRPTGVDLTFLDTGLPRGGSEGRVAS